MFTAKSRTVYIERNIYQMMRCRKVGNFYRSLLNWLDVLIGAGERRRDLRTCNRFFPMDKFALYFDES